MPKAPSSLTIPAKRKLSESHERRLKAGIEARIRLLEECLCQVALMDEEIYAAGIAALESPIGFAEWLCAPTPSLANRTPLACLRTAAGRTKVRRVLAAIDHGVYL